MVFGVFLSNVGVKYLLKQKKSGKICIFQIFVVTLQRIFVQQQIKLIYSI